MENVQEVKHVLGLSGGKDSSALAIYMRDNYPELEIEYFFTDKTEFKTAFVVAISEKKGDQ